MAGWISYASRSSQSLLRAAAGSSVRPQCYYFLRAAPLTRHFSATTSRSDYEFIVTTQPRPGVAQSTC